MSKLIKGVNDLLTINPKLAEEWNYEKNGDLKPTEVTIGSNKKVWWLLSYDDPVIGKHFDFEWEDTIDKRNRGAKCPFLTGHKIWQGFNDLATTNPELAKQWHPTKNGDLKPSDVTAGSNLKTWWLLPYDDAKTGKHFDFEWQATVASRNNGMSCPYLVSKTVKKGFNDLATINPELAKQWHPIKNGNLKPEDVMASSNKKVWWLFPYDDPITGKHYDFEWMSTIANRTRGIGCPFLTGKAVWQGFNDLATLNPDLAKEWHPVKNGKLKPTDVTTNSNKKVWWLFPSNNEDGELIMNEWTSSIIMRNKETVHPFLTVAKTEKFICELLQKKKY